ncbi:hypothetical protein FQN49_000025 [Arthroderma sp. PD_2]|nr:hypothetical protein FQN49_000025 [Arthroderma sp. PD_2]
MRLPFLLLLLCTLLPAVLAEGFGERQPDHQTIAAWGEKGWCFVYVKPLAGDSNKALAPCEIFCKNTDPETDSTACILFGTTSQELVKAGFSYEDDDGNEYVPGKCHCDHGFLRSFFVDPLLEGLSHLDEILCHAFTGAIQLILEVGVPGLRIAQISKFVKVAKTVAENGLDAAAFFDGWLTPACGELPDVKQQSTIFDKLANAPDEYGVSAGCVRKKGCKPRGGGKGDKSGDDKDKDNKTEKKPETEEKTKTEETTKTEEKTKTGEKTKTEETTKTEEKHETTKTERKHEMTTTKHETTTTEHEMTTTMHRSTTTHEPSATPPSCQINQRAKRGNHNNSPTGKKGCRECNYVRAWNDEDFDGDDVESPEGSGENGSVHDVAARGAAAPDWESQALERRAKPKSKTTTTTRGKPTATTTKGKPTATGKKHSGGNGKKVKFCELETHTGNYPGGSDLGKHKKARQADLIHALKNPSCGDFDFGPQPQSDYASKYKKYGQKNKINGVSTHNRNLVLASEHVLEAQMIGIFAKNISDEAGNVFPDPYSDGPMVNFCDYMNAYWNDTNNNPYPTIMKNNQPVTKIATQWIADEYPTTKYMIEEFFLLPNDVNGIKKRTWSHHAIFADKPLAATPTTITKSKSTTVKKSTSTTAPKSTSTSTSYSFEAALRSDDFLTKKDLGESMVVEAIVRFKDVMSAYKYQATPAVQDILEVQAGRISSILDSLDEATEKLNFRDHKPPPLRRFKYNYNPRNLKKKWDEWIKKHTEDSIAHIESFLATQYSKYTAARMRLEKSYKDVKEEAKEYEKANKNKKKNAAEQKVYDTKMENYKADKERYETVIKYLKDLEETYTEMKKNTKWRNPF